MAAAAAAAAAATNIGIPYGDLERRDVKGGHVVLSTTLVLVVDDVLPDVIVGIWVLDLSFSSSVIHNKHKD
jgi:hypothetical protein